MKYCTQCSAVVSENAKFCENCGAKIEKTEFAEEPIFTKERIPLESINSDTAIPKKRLKGKTVYGISMLALIISAVMGANGILEDLTGITAVLSIIMIPISVVWSIADWFKDYKLRKMIGISNAKGDRKNLLIIIPVVLFISILCVLIYAPDINNDTDNVFDLKTETELVDENRNQNDIWSGTSSCDTAEVIDTSMIDTLVELGYSNKQASDIKEILNTIGIDEISVYGKTGEAQKGLNAVVCYANGSKDGDRRFRFTTEDGVLFYAGFLDEDLYDTSKGGFLKKYQDVHIPESYVSGSVYSTLQNMAVEKIKTYLNHPLTADFGAFDWRVGRKDELYMIRGTVEAKNSFGVKDELFFNVWFEDKGDESFVITNVAIDGVYVE